MFVRGYHLCFFFPQTLSLQQALFLPASAGCLGCSAGGATAIAATGGGGPTGSALLARMLV